MVLAHQSENCRVHSIAADPGQLWRRLVFSLLASDYDDHLRNHGFLIVREVFAALSRLRQTGRKLRLKSSTLDAYATAFEHPMMNEAQTLS